MITQSIPRDAQPVTLDVPVLNGECSGLWVGVAGNLDVTFASGSRQTFQGVSAGIFPGKIRQVNSAATTATNLLALYI